MAAGWGRLSPSLKDTVSASRFCPDNLFAYEQNSQSIMGDSEHVCLPHRTPGGAQHEAS
jgi:hypothetical protein